MPNTTVPEQSSSGGVTPPGDRQFELLKMEYEKAAERYENLYRAVWQNFSYLSLLSAAILTFGSNQLQMGATVFLGGVPLLFWFWMQFLPLDAYGRDVRLRLRDIETAFNNEYFKAATTKWDEPGQSWWRKLLGEFPDGNPNPPFRMAHFTEFSGKPRSRCMPRYSTRGGILFSATLAHIIWGGLIIAAMFGVNFLHLTKESLKQEIDVTANLTGTVERPKQEARVAGKISGSFGQPSATPTATTGNSPSTTAIPSASSTITPTTRPTQNP